LTDTTTKLSFRVAATGADLKLRATLDGAVLYEGSPSGAAQTVEHKFDDGQEQEHTLVFEMLGKRPEHTQLDAQGEIVQDRLILISDIAFDDIMLANIVTEQAEYQHDHNGTTPIIPDQFFGTMGCNGKVTLRFTTPIYLWLLENM
jgi:hypothetical protein